MKTAEIEKLYQQYMGYTPTSKDIGQFSMMPADDVNSILSASRKDVQSDAAQRARDAIASLSASLPAGTTGNREYLEQVAGGRATLEQAYGLPEAEGRVQEAEEFYRQIAIRGPMFEEVMRSGLSDISPTFLGATRKETEDYFSAIPNPFVRDKMVGAYLDASDRSLTASLNALNGLYQTALVSAQTAMQNEQSHYNRVADKSKELYSELQWLARNRYEEQEREREGERGLAQQKELEAFRTGLKEPVPAGYSGRYSEDQLAQRANSYVLEDGNINWIALDQLENVDKDLWNDMNIFFENAMSGDTGEAEMLKSPTPEPRGLLKVGETIKEAWQQAPSNIRWLFE